MSIVRNSISDTSSFYTLNKNECRGVERLLNIVQQLSLARSIESIMLLIRKEARLLAQSDGATFVLRDQDNCYYADEDAIAPLWKGKRFPMELCISGWVMLNKKSVIIEDIYSDPRIPHEAYKSTFVKSLVMVPIRSESPIGAIGNYWSQSHIPTPEEIYLLEALANSTSVAMENVQLYSELEQRVKDRTLELELVNKELESFSYTLSHDLKTYLQGISGFSSLLLKMYKEKLDDKASNLLDKICDSAHQMNHLIEDILNLSRCSRTELKIEQFDLSSLVSQTLSEIKQLHPIQVMECNIQPDVLIKADARLMKVVLINLLGNAHKFSSKKSESYIEFGVLPEKKEQLRVFFIKDHGAGFDMRQAGKLFKAFERLHTDAQFPGTGIGLATVTQVISKHRGDIWAESKIDEGTTIYFTLGTDI